MRNTVPCDKLRKVELTLAQGAKHDGSPERQKISEDVR
jgi:hypothetical protein